MSNELTYTTAKQELQAILKEIESENVDLDQLSEKVKRATELIEFCREKLKGSEEKINSILQDLENQPTND